MREVDNIQLEICLGFVNNAPHTFRCYNPFFTRELEEVKVQGDRYPDSESVAMDDMNSRVGLLQVNGPHIWDSLKTQINNGTISLEVGQLRTKFVTLRKEAYRIL
jgi:hypothetical protein